jgi:hypothetical protein
MSLSQSQSFDVTHLLTETHQIGEMLNKYKTETRPFIYNNITGISFDHSDDEEFETIDAPPTDEEIKQQMEKTHIKLRIDKLEHELRYLQQMLMVLSGNK